MAGNCDGVLKMVAAGCGFQAGGALSGQQGPHSAEHPDGPLQIHQLVVQSSPLCSLLQIPCLEQAQQKVVGLRHSVAACFNWLCRDRLCAASSRYRACGKHKQVCVESQIAAVCNGLLQLISLALCGLPEIVCLYQALSTCGLSAALLQGLQWLAWTAVEALNVELLPVGCVHEV